MGVGVFLSVIISLYGWDYYVYINTAFGFYGSFFFFFFKLLRCLSMIVWTPAVLGVLYACVLHLHLFSAIEHVSHGKAL